MRELGLLAVGLELVVEEAVEVRRRIGDGEDAELRKSIEHVWALLGLLHFAPQLVGDIRRQAGRTEEREPAAVVPILRYARFGRGGHLGQSRMALVARPGEHAYLAALVVRHQRRGRSEHRLHLTLRERSGRRPAALVWDVRHLDARQV